MFHVLFFETIYYYHKTALYTVYILRICHRFCTCVRERHSLVWMKHKKKKKEKRNKKKKAQDRSRQHGATQVERSYRHSQQLPVSHIVTGDCLKSFFFFLGSAVAERHVWSDFPNHSAPPISATSMRLLSSLKKIQFFCIFYFFLLRCTWGQKKNRKKQRKRIKTLNQRSRTNRNTFENWTDDDPLSSQEKIQKDGRTDGPHCLGATWPPLASNVFVQAWFSFFFLFTDRVFHTASNTVIDRLLLEDSFAGSQSVLPEGR